ncbi:MAG: hypothetical protein ACREC4_00885 [Methylocella sp.]
MTRSCFIKIAVIIHHETKPGNANEGAILVSRDWEIASSIWLQKSMIHIERKKDLVVVMLPLNMAFETRLAWR